MIQTQTDGKSIQTRLEKPKLAPWLSLRKGTDAAQFYKKAFGAVEEYRLDMLGGESIVKLSIGDAELWVGEQMMLDLESRDFAAVRMVLTVHNVEEYFEKAVEEGASIIAPLGNSHGWKIGRIVDPFGIHWEIGHPLDAP